jgi:hypothetical protein
VDGLTLLERAREAGLAVRMDGESLVIGGPRRAAAIAQQLLAHKREVMAAMALSAARARATSRHEWTVQDWSSCYEERAKFLQYVGGHPRLKAERLAWSELQSKWHIEHGARVDPALCAGCGRPIGERQKLALPDGTAVHLDTFDCLVMYGKRWRGAADTALIEMGLTRPY